MTEPNPIDPPAAPRRRRWLRRLARGIGALALALVVLLAGAFAYAQTDLAKGQIATLAEDALATAGQNAEIEDIKGLLPFNVRIGAVRLSDGEGAWLEVDGARLRWSPSALLRGRILVREVGADRVALHRAPPALPATPPAEAEPFRLPQIPELPASLPEIALERLHVGRIEIGAPLLGEAAIFTLEGTGNTGQGGTRPSAVLSLTRIDAPTAALELRAEADLAARSAALRLEATETGGLLGGVTGRPEAGALRLVLDGTGPLADWRADLDLEAERLLRLDSALALGLDRLPRIAWTAELVAAPGALPATIAPLLGERATLALDLVPTSPDRVALKTLRLELPLGTITGSGSADLASGGLAGRIAMAVPDLAPLSGLAGSPMAGAVDLTLTAAGRLERPELDVALRGRGLALDTLSAATLDLDLAPRLRGDLAGGFPGVDVTGSGGITGIAQAGAAPLGQDRLDVALDAGIPATGLAELRRLALTAPAVSVVADGRLDPATLEGRARLVADIPALAALLATLPGSPPISGGISFQSDSTIAPGAARIDTDLALRTQALAGLPAGAAELLGPTPSLTAAITFLQGQAIEVTRLRLDAPGASLDGTARLGLERQEIAAGLTARVPTLAPLRTLAGQDLAGAVTLDLAVAGTASAPDLTAALVVEKLAAAGLAFQTVRLDATAAGPQDAMRGRVTLSAKETRGTLDLATGWALTGRSLTLYGLSVTAPATSLHGELALDLATTLATGGIAGRVADLAPLRPFTGQELRGAVDLDVKLAVEAGRQGASATASARGIAGSFGTIESVALRAAGRDLLGMAAVDASLELAGFAQPGVAVESASVTAAGPLAEVRVRAAGKGRQEANDFDVRAAASLAVLGEPKRVVLESIEGSYAGQPVQLLAPARLTLDKGVLDLDRLDLRFGEAHTRSRARYGAGRIDAALTLEPTPLAMLRSFGAPPLTGTIDARLTATGRTAAPEIALVLAGRDVRPAKAPPGLKPARLDATARIAGGSVDATASVAGVTTEPLRAELRAPLRLGLEPFAFDLPQNGTVRGSLVGRADLAELGTIAMLDGQRLAGTLATDLRLAGTVATPTAQGSIAIERGRIEDAISGVLLRDLELRITGDRDRLVLSRLEAKDRRNGRLTGAGSVGLDGLSPKAIDLDLRLDNVEVLRNELGTARLSGEVGLAGDLAAARVAGKLKVERADLRIPDPAAGGPPTIAVREAGVPIDVDPAAGRAGEPARIALDVAVDLPGQVFVRGRGLESEWGGALAVKGTATEPEIMGQISFRRGFLDLLDRRFLIDKGVITFDGRRPPIPAIDILAGSQGVDMRALVAITGPADKIELALSSDPPYPQDEVLSRLLFGRPAAQITPAQGLRLANAVRQLESGGEGPLDLLRKGLGVDTLDVGGTGPDDASAKAGKYVSDRVYMEVERGLAPQSGKARVEIELTPSISAKTEVGEDAQTGVQLQWKYDW